MRWRSWVSRLSLLATIGVVTVAAGCGGDRGGSEPPAASASAAFSSPVTGGSPVPAESPGGSGSPVSVPQGEVSVVVAAAAYPVGAVVHATVANGMDRALYTEDFKTACSIAFLQRRDGAPWTDIAGCRNSRIDSSPIRVRMTR
jgi:hypothetical protein